MGLFNRKKSAVNGLIGLDIGASGFKLVELVRIEKRLTLSTYGIARPITESGSAFDLLKDAKAAGKAIAELAKKAGVQQKKINVSLPSHSVFHAMITLPVPKKAGEDLRPLVEAKVQPLLPMPLADMIIDSTVIDKNLLPKPLLGGKKEIASESATAELAIGEDDNKTPAYMRVLVSGSPKALVEQYVAMVEAAGFELQSLETESFALIRALVGNDRARLMIVDIGDERTNITIVQEGLPFLHRSIKIGGQSITKQFQQRLGVDKESAEQIKRDLSKDTNPEPPEAVKLMMEPIVHEIRYSLQLFAEQDFTSQGGVEKIIVTGGSAHIPYIDTLLTRALKVNVYIGDPWARIMTPPPMRPLLDSIGPEMSVAIGLGMKEN